MLVVTGSSKGIGNRIALTLSEKHSITYGISSSGLNTTSSKRITNIKLDLESINQIENNLRDKFDFSHHKKISVVLCASQLGNPGGLFDSDLSDWNKIYNINVLGNLSVLKFVVKNMHPSSTLRVVFFAGGGSAYGYPEFFGYSLSKVATVRAVENVGLEFSKTKLNASIIALAPGAVATDMLAKVISHGGTVKTKTDISEPVAFVDKFLNDELNSKQLNGRFLHVRDDQENTNTIEFLSSDKFKLRRIQ